ncbi:MAG: threonine--tRNA ligase [Gammaproteobacteria bacterium]|nr:threonine--tRNA ligase [Gammaproteobacteria bacterium]NNM19796.1 threonine--tRNA ligase [Gammaproteobacteria bacterium]
MPVLTLPDGSKRSFDTPVSVADLAADIGPGLARAALAGRVDGQLVDTSHVIDEDSEVAIVTAKDEDGLEVLRHSTAHLLAQAVKELFPSAQITIGPVIDDGFYYDFSFERPFTPEDLEKIEARMKKLAAADLPVQREVLARDEAIAYFRSEGEHYKAEIIEAIPADEEIGLYRQGDWKDLCRGPHVPSTGRIKAFKLTKLAGAYWRGDSNNEMLQRIYGTAWPNKDALKAYLHRLEEAEKRDHRRFGKLLDLFHTQPEAPGMVFWHDKGWRLYRTIQDYLRTRLEEAGYQEVHTPQILDRSLWEKSGHWGKYGENMFTTGSENRQYAIKPMNCPCHVQIFNQHLHSYRDLPIRMAEFGSCHRNEASGTLHGLMRVRNFTQDDAHIFCTEGQIQQEVAGFIELLMSVYADFGFDDVSVALSTRPEKRVGEDALWDKAEQALAQALEQIGLEHRVEEGEGAFYGPKIDFFMHDSIGRVWQLGTVQLDFSMPARLGAKYVDRDSSHQVPVMLHRAILGSLERFIGVLIEHFAGSLPPWLAPVQAVVLTITDRQAAYAEEVAQSLKKQGFQVETDLRNEKIGLKIREHTIQRVPYLLVVGDREQADKVVAVRTRSGEDLGGMSTDKFAGRLAEDCARRGRISLED